MSKDAKAAKKFIKELDEDNFMLQGISGNPEKAYYEEEKQRELQKETEDKLERLSEEKNTFIEYMNKKGIDYQNTWNYDYEAAWMAGDRPVRGKWPSKYKHDLSPERYQSTTKGWLDTKASDIEGKNVYVDWTQVLTQEMNRDEQFPDMGFDSIK